MQTWTLANGTTVIFDKIDPGKLLTLSPEEAVRVGWRAVNEEDTPDSDILSLAKWTGGNRVGKAFVARMDAEFLSNR